MKEIQELAEQMEGQMIADFRRFHRNPELSNEEKETSLYVAAELRKMGIEVKEGYAGYGLQGMLWGANPNGKTIMLRADMDALPIQEETGLNYQSQKENVMHACGHDAHTAALLGAARILSAQKERLQGNVKFCFQPAEEGDGGAKSMVKDGIMKNPTVDYAVGMHVEPSQKVGQASIEPGAITSFPNFFEYRITGKGGHGAFPYKSVDPIKPATVIYAMLEGLAGRISPLEPHVIQVCTIQAGQALAVIPDQAIIGGTTRTVTDVSQAMVREKMEQIAEHIESLYGVECTFTFKGVSRPVVNAPEFVEPVKACLADIFDGGYVINETMKTGGEDFCFYCEDAPATYFLVGSANDDPATQFPHHNPRFCVDERVIKKSAEAFATIAVKYLADELGVSADH